LWWRLRITGRKPDIAAPAQRVGAIDIDHPLGVPERPDDEYVYWEN
jgi:hypothetical protein